MGRKTPELRTIRELLKATFTNYLGITQAASIEGTPVPFEGKAHLCEAFVLSLAD